MLAGCLGDGGGDVKSSSNSTNSTVDAGGGIDGGDTGSIRGFVTDDEKQPIGDASVYVAKPSVTSKTDAAGAYAILNLPAADYNVFSQKLGYDAQAKKVTVTAGQTTYVNFTLVAIAASGEAYPETTSHKAKLQCMLRTAGWVSSCSYPYTAVYLTAHEHGVNLSSYGAQPDIMDNKWRYNFSARQGATVIVSEMIWKAQSDAATTLNMRLCKPIYDAVNDDCPQYAAAAGKSPAYVAWEAKAALPKTVKQTWIMSAVWPTFPEASEAAQQGVFLDQTVEMFNSVWYNGEPAEGWSLTKEPTS